MQGMLGLAQPCSYGNKLWPSESLWIALSCTQRSIKSMRWYVGYKWASEPFQIPGVLYLPTLFPWTAVGVSARLTQSRAWGPWIFVVSPVECHYWVFQICDHAPAPCQLYLFIFGLFRCKSAAHCKFSLSQDAIDFKSMRAKAWVLRVFASVHDMKDFKWL